MERGLLRGGWRESSVSGCASFCIDRRGLDVNARRVRSWKARGVRRALSGRVGDIISSSSMVSGVECRNVRSRSFMSWTFDRDQFRVYRDGCTSRQESSTRFHLFFDHVLSIFHFISFFYCPPIIYYCQPPRPQQYTRRSPPTPFSVTTLPAVFLTPKHHDLITLQLLLQRKS